MKRVRRTQPRVDTPNPFARLPPELLGHTFSFQSKEEEWENALATRMWTIASLTYGRRNISKLFAYACSHGDLATVQYIHSLQMDCDRTTPKALIKACCGGHLSIAQWLVSLGADIHAHHDEALINACRGGHLAVVHWLVGSGADIHEQYDGALLVACHEGHMDIVQCLVNFGADIHAQNGRILFAAYQGGHLAIARWLVGLGAKSSARNKWFLSICANTKIQKWLKTFNRRRVITKLDQVYPPQNNRFIYLSISPK